MPADLSLSGCDDITMSNYTNLPLTTVGVVKEHMGRRAMTRLLELVEATNTKVETELIPVDWVIRSSTAKVRSARVSVLLLGVALGRAVAPATLR